MRIPINLPLIPEQLDVEAEFIQGDASIRHDNAIRLCISWPHGDEGAEMGFELFLCQHCLTNPTAKFDIAVRHDTRCIFKLLHSAAK